MTPKDTHDQDREEFLYVVEIARALHDPAIDWDGFWGPTLWALLILSRGKPS